TRNPGVWLPYIRCVLMSLGMLVHFGQKLFAFLTRGASVDRSARASALRPSNVWIVAGAGAVLVIGGIVYAARPKSVPAGGFDYEAFAKLPCLDGGRVKPLDTVARVALTVINTKQTVVDPAGRPVSPIQWLLDVMTLQPRDVEKSDIAQIPFFRIDNLDVVQQLGFENRPGVFRYSLKELKPKFDLIEKDADRADDIESKKRSLADQKILDLRRHLMEFLRLNSLRLAVLPPETGGAIADWKVVGDYTPEAIDRQALANLKQQAEQGRFDPKALSEEQLLKMIREQRDKLAGQVPESARAFLAILGAYQANDPRRFNEAVAAFANKYEYRPAGESLRRVDVEQWYNRAAPFFHLMFDYLLAATIVFIGWLLVSGMPRTASACFAAGVGMTVAAFAVHIVALLARMYLMDRPLVFVTNLYSSALFIAACAAGVGLFVEWMYGRGIGIALGATTAAAGLFVGYSIDLGVEGDKLEMLQAVLDTNFWLATHVTTVTFGYAATFLAGGVGLAYVLLGVGTHVLADTNLRKLLAGLIYGLVAFATLLSFVGTVLGGIWADYSWGRFWGWDPKENGAMLIVLWNALVLHARWGGLVKAHGVAVLSICGIAVTAWSWFGTNQLGVGLHSYGFTSAAAQALTWLAVGVAVSAGIGCLPERMWLSATPGKTRPA
ncbi:MAG: cytochrome c biogenesis protein CcsA, partial [Gemmataceae bacterium]|nr:cytochrome c biogenesis protein CcsA [Gemmataceae bacterium]